MLRILTLFTAAIAITSTANAETQIDVLPLTANCDWAVGPNHDGIVLSTTNGDVAVYLVSTTTDAGTSWAEIVVSGNGAIADQSGTSGLRFGAPVILERSAEIAYAFGATSDTSSSAASSSWSSRSWLDDYANWFNSTFGSGWSESVGGVIHTGLTTVIDDETLANTSDGAILTGTVIVSVPTAVAIVAGGEVVLGVGTFGGAGGTAAGGGALLGAEAEIAAAHAEIAAMEAQIATLEAGIAEGIATAEQIETAQAAIAILRARIADLWAFIDFLLGLL